MLGIEVGKHRRKIKIKRKDIFNESIFYRNFSFPDLNNESIIPRITALAGFGYRLPTATEF